MKRGTLGRLPAEFTLQCVSSGRFPPLAGMGVAFVLALACAAGLGATNAASGTNTAPGTNAAPAAAAEEYPLLPKPGSKVTIDAGHYFVYGFDRQPKLGSCIMRVEIFGGDGKRVTSFAVKGAADMPSMRGAHGSGEKDFALSDKGMYLMPVRLVMPGEWEIRFMFMKEGNTVFRGAYRFSI